MTPVDSGVPRPSPLIDSLAAVRRHAPKPRLLRRPEPPICRLRPTCPTPNRHPIKRVAPGGTRLGSRSARSRARPARRSQLLPRRAVPQVRPLRAVNDITPTDTIVEENDYHEALATLERAASTVERIEVLRRLRANVQFEDNITSKVCCFCGTPIVAGAVSTSASSPRRCSPSLSPSGTPSTSTGDGSRRSGSHRPSSPRKRRSIPPSSGAYMPFWTYDCVATTSYTGMRGEDYWVTESYTAVVNGKPQRRTRRVRKTRWYPAAGTVVNDFDDVLVPASTSCRSTSRSRPSPGIRRIWFPMPTSISRASAASPTAWICWRASTGAKVRMRPTIEATIRGHIGGDHQRITRCTRGTTASSTSTSCCRSG